MTDITETVAEVLRLEAQATKGPWDYWFEVGTRLGPDREHPIALVKQMRRARCPGAGGAGVDADAALISHYRTAAPALAREVQRLQGALLVDTAILEGYRAGLERAASLCRARADRYAAQVEQREPGSGGRIVADARSAEAEACANAIRDLEVSHD